LGKGRDTAGIETLRELFLSPGQGGPGRVTQNYPAEFIGH